MNLSSAGQLIGTRPDLYWAWITLALSAAVALGYAAIAFNWYFQRKVASPQAKAALVRLLLISVACAVCGGGFYASEGGWGDLRVCGVAIAGVGGFTWPFV